MLHSPTIANLPLQSLQVPVGWSVTFNHFYQLDPDDDLVGRKILHLESDSITDPWEDVLYYYFDVSYLWQAIRRDKSHLICLEWSIMGDRDGHFVLQQFDGSPVHFDQPPPQTLTKEHEKKQITYELDEPTTFPDEPVRIFESRDRPQVVDVLNQWLDECSCL
jgi:hypothetical protein